MDVETCEEEVLLYCLFLTKHFIDNFLAQLLLSLEELLLYPWCWRMHPRVKC